MSTEKCDQITSAANPQASNGSLTEHQIDDVASSFRDLDADSDIDRISCVESLCMNCQETGLTRMLLTRIPYFRDIVVMSFDCPHCHAKSAEIQPANEIAPKACRVTLMVNANNPDDAKQDLNRQVIKSETCKISIPEMEFEIPPNSRRGDINTVEGVLKNVADSLQAGQPVREIVEPEVAAKIHVVIEAFRSFADGSRSFTFILDDLAGNSFLENPYAPSADHRVKLEYYDRTREETLELGYAVEENMTEMDSMQAMHGEEAPKKIAQVLSKNASDGSDGDSKTTATQLTHSEAPRGVSVAPQAMPLLDTYFNVTDRSATFMGVCNACSADCETRMCVTDVPHFKDIVLLVTLCDACGFRDAEVKPIGAVSAKGRRITLKVTSIDDLKRDLLKSDTASCEIPELELELVSGTLGGKYTTLEGLLEDIRTQLSKTNSFMMGDSSLPTQRSKMASFIDRLTDLNEVKEPWTFILDDPLGNVFIYSPLGEGDPHLSVERYDRTFKQNEDLGLNDINVDDYMDEDQKKELQAELKKEHDIIELEKQMATVMSYSSSDLSVSSARSSETQHLADLQQSKIGGLISVDHSNDQEGTATIKRFQTVSSVVISSASDSKQ